MGELGNEVWLPYDKLLAYEVAAQLLVDTAEGAGRDSLREKARAYVIARGEVTEAVAAMEIAAMTGDCDAKSAMQARALAGRAIGLLTGLIKKAPST